MPDRTTRSRFSLRITTLACVMIVAGVAHAEDSKPPEPSRIAMFLPLAVQIDATTKVTARGWNLEGIKELTSSSETIQIKLLSTAKATVPNGLDAKNVGDTQVEFEITVPKDFVPGEISIAVSGETGKSEPSTLLAGSESPVVDEKEWNDGFRQSQKLAVPQTVDGGIHENRNVDVFSFELAEQQQVTIEVIAARRGSSLDSLLTIFTARGTVLAVNDDHDKSADSKLTIDLSPGLYYLSLQDAHDRGSVTHPYRLAIGLTNASGR